MANAAAESGFQTDAKATTSSATGLYQFTAGTWMGMVAQHGAEIGLGREAAAIRNGTLDEEGRQRILALRNDAKTSAYMAASYAKDNRERLEQSIGGEIGDTEIYMAHFLGGRGAEKFLTAWRSNPDRPAAEVVPDAAAANRSIFYRNGKAQTLDEVYQRMAAKIGGDVPDRSAMPKTWLAQAPATNSTAGSVVADLMGPSRAALQKTPSTLQAQLYMASLSLPGETARPAQAAARDAAKHITPNVDAAIG